jgi:hypothetical protein
MGSQSRRTTNQQLNPFCRTSVICHRLPQQCIIRVRVSGNTPNMYWIKPNSVEKWHVSPTCLFSPMIIDGMIRQRRLLPTRSFPTRCSASFAFCARCGSCASRRVCTACFAPPCLPCRGCCRYAHSDKLQYSRHRERFLVSCQIIWLF